MVRSPSGMAGDTRPPAAVDAEFIFTDSWIESRKRRCMMRGKPIIGINADYRNAKKDSPAFSFLSAGYYDAILKAGGIPLIIPPQTNQDDLERILDLLDGIVFVGGADLDPRRDGYMLHPSIRLLEERREDFDRLLMQLVSLRRLPILAIGVGMQLLNLSQGGNLFLHLPEDCPKAIPHKDPLDAGHRHSLTVVPGTMLERVYGDSEIRVNSMHHMACDEIAPGFVVSARCPDGVVEAIESIQPDWLAVGTQFHPEADSASALDVRIFEEFVYGITGIAPELKLVA
ncbi:MAG: gamma-glutamyl-gamma-aminobutyrate hydrolase family protein [Pirellulales bacterium]|nr:gamma-glutamyl-gamma-aminobutyrate hydrolase family protein [Pirellulales bacterium]